MTPLMYSVLMHAPSYPREEIFNALLSDSRTKLDIREKYGDTAIVSTATFTAAIIVASGFIFSKPKGGFIVIDVKI